MVDEWCSNICDFFPVLFLNMSVTLARYLQFLEPSLTKTRKKKRKKGKTKTKQNNNNKRASSIIFLTLLSVWLFFVWKNLQINSVKIYFQLAQAIIVAPKWMEFTPAVDLTQWTEAYKTLTRKLDKAMWCYCQAPQTVGACVLFQK